DFVSYLAIGGVAAAGARPQATKTPPPATSVSTGQQPADRPTYSVRDFGAMGRGADETTAIRATIAAASAAHPGGCNIYVPPGRYLVTDMLAIGNAMAFIGAGTGATYFNHRPTADGTFLRVSSGRSQSLNNVIGGFTIYSDDTTHAKRALQLMDVSSCDVGNIYIGGSGAGTPRAPYYTGGTGSMGLVTNGREVSHFHDLRICADYPVYIGPNPNTAPTDGEDCDHFHFEDCYLVGKGHYCYTVEPGIGVMQLTIDGFQAWVGGTGGFSMNDTRAAPVVPSRGITIKDVRGEQCTDPDGYLINIAAAARVQTAQLTNVMSSSGSQGIKVNRCLQLALDLVLMATKPGKNSLLVEGGIGGSTVSIRDSYFQPDSVFTLTDYQPVSIEAWDRGKTQGPSTATYAVTRNNTALTVDEVSAKRLFPGTPAGAIQAGCGIYAGTGAPSNANGRDGEYYFRSDTPGTANQRIYVKAGGSWIGIV
ncbi:MAG: glycosyl hydrolase family 28-related protein, partial [Gemmatimonadota bacterium]